MPLPDRPVSAASIESVWGQQIHDYTFAPAGVACHTSSNTTVSTAYLGLNLDTADEDPGGYLDVPGEAVVIPTNGAGLYAINCDFGVSSSVDDQLILCAIFLNGAIAKRVGIPGETGVSVSGTIGGHITLTAGDIVQPRAKRVGAPNVGVNCTLSLVRLGAEYGSP